MEQRGELHDAWVGTLRHAAEEPRTPWWETARDPRPAVVLRPLPTPTCPGCVESLDDPETQHFSEGPRERAPHTIERWPDLVEERREWAARGEAVAWTVADPDTDLHLGLAQLYHLSHRRQAELGFWAHPDARGRGLTTRAVRTVLRHAFVPWEDGGLGLRRVHAHAATANTASCRVLAAAGLHLTGATRGEALLGDGTWSDTTRFDLLAEEWV